MKKIILATSLVCNAVLLYRLNEDKKDIYDLTERAHFYKQKFDENLEDH